MEFICGLIVAFLIMVIMSAVDAEWQDRKRKKFGDIDTEYLELKSWPTRRSASNPKGRHLVA